MCRSLIVAAMLILVSSCGGGRDEPPPELRRPNAASIGGASSGTVTVADLVKVGERRVSRTVFDYEFQLRLRNEGQKALRNVVARIKSVGAGSSVMDAAASVQLLEAGQQRISDDTVIIRHDRLHAFAPALIAYDYTHEIASVLPSTVLLDPHLPLPILGQVKRALAATAETVPGDTLLLPSPDGIRYEQLFVGASTAGEPVLLAIARGDPLLSVESTALALVRLATDTLGDLPNVDGGVAINAILKQSPHWSALVNHISAVLSQGGELLSSSIVDSVWLVAEERRPNLLAHVSSTQGSLRRALAVTSAPHTLWDKGATNTMTLGDEPGDGVALLNRTFLFWNATSLDEASSVTLFNGIAAPLGSSWARYIGFYGGTETRTGIPGSQRFKLTLTQTADSRVANVNILIGNIVHATLNALMAVTPLQTTEIQKCAINLSKSLVNVPELSLYAATGKSEDLLKVAAVVRDRMAPTLLSACDATKFNALDWLPVFFASTKKIVTALKVTDSTHASFGTYNQMTNEDKTSITETICQREGVVSSCAGPATSLVAIPARVYATPGVRVSSHFKLEARDSTGASVPLPSKLTYKLRFPNNFVTLDPETGEIWTKPEALCAGCAASIATIEVSDPLSGAFGLLDVWVVQVALTPSPLQIKVGETAPIAVAYYDGSGAPHRVALPDAARWEASDARVAEFSAAQNSRPCPSGDVALHPQADCKYVTALKTPIPLGFPFASLVTPSGVVLARSFLEVLPQEKPPVCSGGDVVLTVTAGFDGQRAGTSVVRQCTSTAKAGGSLSLASVFNFSVTADLPEYFGFACIKSTAANALSRPAVMGGAQAYCYQAFGSVPATGVCAQQLAGVTFQSLSEISFTPSMPTGRDYSDIFVGGRLFTCNRHVKPGLYWVDQEAINVPVRLYK